MKRKDKNQKQTQPTYDAEFGNRKQLKWVGGFSPLSHRASFAVIVCLPIC